MCIIAYIPAGKQIKEDTIRYMFRGNPDGAGIMWKPKDGAPIEIHKGFMTVEALLEAYKRIPVNCEKAIHCRIATSGKVSAACCHPFPVRAKVKAMREERDSEKVALMHNGIISYTTPTKGMASDYSDTMLFASKVLYPLQKQLNEWHIQTLIEESTNSRLLIFRQDGETLVLGDWKFEDGIYYSNGNYKATVYDGLYGNYYGNFGSWYKGGTQAATTTKNFKAQKAAPATIEEPREDVDDCKTHYQQEQQDDLDTSFFWLEVKEDDVREDLAIEDEVWGELVEAGYELSQIYTETDKDGKRYIIVEIFDELPADINTIAGMKILAQATRERVKKI